MDEPRREAVEMIIREALRMRILAVAAGLEEIVLMLERVAHQGRADLVAAGHEPRPDPPSASNVVTLPRI